MRRMSIIALIGLGVVVFIAISLLLTRVLTVNGREQSAVAELIKAQARGDRQGMVDRLDNCRQTAGCVARAATDAAALKRAGKVSIIDYSASAGFSLGATTGTARVAWKTPSSLPIVQCVRIRRAGNPISGITIRLRLISLRIPSDSSCPPNY
jgi:hypothetical protein